MPKRKQSKTKGDKTGISFLFPDTLRGKKLERFEDETSLITELSQTYLVQYLETENPDWLVKATNESFVLLQGKGQNLEVEEYLGRPTPEYVDAYTVVWETIRWWQQLHNWLGDEKEAKEAKKYLSKIALALIIPRKETIETFAGDGLKHITPKEKGKKPYLTYQSPNEFIQYYERVKKVFKETRSKQRYGSFDKQLETEDTLKALGKLGYELKSETDLRYYFNMSNIHTKAISFICMAHIRSCPVCKKQGLSDDTILRLLKKAQEELKTQQS